MAQSNNPNVNVNVGIPAYSSLQGNATWSANNYTIDTGAYDLGLSYYENEGDEPQTITVSPHHQVGLDAFLQGRLTGNPRNQFNSMVSLWEYERCLWLFKNHLSGRNMEPGLTATTRDCPIMLTPIYNVGDGRDTNNRVKYRNDSRIVHHVDRFNGFPVASIEVARRAWNDAVLWFRRLYEVYLIERETTAVNNPGFQDVMQCIRVRSELAAGTVVPVNWVPNVDLMNAGNIEEIRRGLKRRRVSQLSAIRFVFGNVPIALEPAPGGGAQVGEGADP